jgi:hypothetical protein
VAWDYSNGVVTPTLTGTMLMYNERCFRVSITNWDGSKKLDVKHGTKRCVKNDSDTRQQAIDLSGVPDARTDRVTVADEEQNQNNDDWWSGRSRASTGGTPSCSRIWTACSSSATGSTSAAARSTPRPATPTQRDARRGSLIADLPGRGRDADQPQRQEEDVE